MAWRIVLQPNGLLARFSDVVDDFTHMEMTRDDALRVCRAWCSPQEAEEKVLRGERDEPMGGFVEDDGQPLKRWRDSLATVRAVHGEWVVAERLRAGGGTP